MRVLTVGNLYPPHHFGGYEQVWASAVRHLRAGGHDVEVLATDYRHDDGGGEDREPGIHRTLRWYWADHDFGPLPLHRRLAVERHNHREFGHRLEALAPDIISFWSMGGMSHSLIEAGRLRGLPMVAFVHDQWLDYGRSTDQWTRMFAARRYRAAAPVVQALTGLPTTVSYGKAGRYVFVSDFVAERARQLDLDLSDVDVAHSGIASIFLDAAADHEWRWRLLYVGRLHPDKGIEEAVRCLTALPEPATLTFAGQWDPRDESALDQLIGELGLRGRVTMLGRRSPQEVADLYRESDALLFPVRWDEPWGLVPLEAMACGCPVVATGRGGSGEYLRDADNCLLVPDHDPGALAAAIRRLADEPGLRDRLRAGGLGTAPRYTEAGFNASVERHLTEMAARPRPSGVHLRPELALR